MQRSYVTCIFCFVNCIVDPLFIILTLNVRYQQWQLDTISSKPWYTFSTWIHTIKILYLNARNSNFCDFKKLAPPFAISWSMLLLPKKWFSEWTLLWWLSKKTSQVCAAMYSFCAIMCHEWNQKIPKIVWQNEVCPAFCSKLTLFL